MRMRLRVTHTAQGSLTVPRASPQAHGAGVERAIQLVERLLAGA